MRIQGFLGKKMERITIIIGLIAVLLMPSLVMAIDTAPMISDREIVERLTKLEEGKRNLEKRIGDFRSEINTRFDILQWMLGFLSPLPL